MSAGTIRPETLARELAAEVEYWKSRALTLSEAVTDLSEKLAELTPAPGVEEAEVVDHGDA